MYVEGLVHITELGGEYFRFDEARQELRGERSGIRYAIGTRVRIQVSRVDLDGRKIDFRLVREGEELFKGALRDKGVGRDMGRDGARVVAVDGNESDAFRATDRRASRKSAGPSGKPPKPTNRPSKAASKSRDKTPKSRRRS